ncbi:FxsA family protein [Ferviditalea candida]|uniref:FxsA family protein n=1 Tax=Ferviditalea candida TaxID=3108399 RepID=A0ABU5ZDF6_9BACL|nr:FxsA family protein [Paenibacillaceae bacterium T2]
MLRILVVLMIIIPAIEIWGLINVGRWIGGVQTFALILLSGFLGAFLAKREASKVWHYARSQLAIGQIPTRSILDGICIFAGGLLLLAPGFFTDILGLLLVLPGSRSVFAFWILRYLQKKIAFGDIRFFFRR